MTNFALWIDHAHAYVYKFQDGVVEETKFHASEMSIPEEKIGHDNKFNDHNHFYHHIAENLKDVHKLLVMGPGIAKNEFKHHCEKHHHTKLANEIIGLEPMESHPTKMMIIHAAQKYFKNLSH
jgi:stalled ribosome rescue protein Dom34